MLQVILVILGTSLLMTLMICLVIYPLYSCGLLTFNMKRALTFVGRIGGRSPCRGRFSACTGSMRRIMRFRESGTVEFALGVELDKGGMTVELTDVKKKTLLMSLDAESPIARIAVDQDARYELCCRFAGATGMYELRWGKTA